jgi:L-ascorbate metabolism protein UlaG (beta-lactamase superfamily)
MKPLDTGLNSWQHSTNHNRMIEQQARCLTAPTASDTSGAVQLTFFGSSAFQITSPGGLTIMVDPWRNHPSGKWDWYFADFPLTSVDIGVSTHAHFDHDALHRLDASVTLDRLIGTYVFSDVKISGIADKHATDASDALYDFRQIILDFDGIDITPPDNPRSWDNCLITVETGGLRLLHWGDNRHNPPEEIWQVLGHTDVLLIPVDDSQHVLGFTAVQEIIERVQPSIVVPHHYYSREIVQRQSTLQPASHWLAQYNGAIIETTGPTYTLDSSITNQATPTVLYFGDHVGFDCTAWRQSG